MIRPVLVVTLLPHELSYSWRPLPLLFSCFRKLKVKTLVNVGTLWRTHCCPWCFLGYANWENLLRTQNVSEQNQKHFLCPGHKICVRNKCYTRGQTGKHLCRQQCVRNNMSSFARALSALFKNAGSSLLRPIYTVRLCRIRQAYDGPTTWIFL